jgi:prolyl oligopeptidase PreP (S9A serine peptidase family)
MRSYTTMSRDFVRRWFVVLAVALALQAQGAAQRALPYPDTRKVDHVDVHHGTRVADPYRWLEGDTSAETARWVEAQNAVTFAYLESIPFRPQVHARLEALFDYPRYTAPSRKGGLVFYSRNDGLQNQSVLYAQAGLDGTPEVLLDPNTWSDDGTSRLTTFAPSRTASHAAYGMSSSGSDWQEYRVLDLRTRRALDDRLQWIKVSSIAWHGDGFYYSRYPAPEAGQELSSRNEDHRVYYHRLGTPQTDDELVYRDEANPQRFHMVSTTEDERFAVLSVSDRGTGRMGNALFVRNLARGDKAFLPLIPSIGDHGFAAIDNVGDRLLAYDTTQVFYESKDGTRVPMFLVHRKDLQLDGNNPTLLYGYGGFNVSQTPSFSAARLVLAGDGRRVRVANLRGGGEYGEKWHEAGTKLKKQNVFDDFIAAAEWLVAKGYTRPEARIQGGATAACSSAR